MVKLSCRLSSGKLFEITDTHTKYQFPQLPEVIFTIFYDNNDNNLLGSFNSKSGKLITYCRPNIDMQPYWLDVKKIIHIHFSGYSDTFFNITKNKYIKAEKQ